MVRVFTGKRFLFEADLAGSFSQKLLGIMFCGTLLRKPFERPLLFVFDSQQAFGNSIHSLFCFCSFDAVFLDSSKRVVQVIPTIAPWNPMITPKRPCKYLLELPSGRARAKKLSVGSRLSFALNN